jgi:hypothetical protein
MHSALTSIGAVEIDATLRGDSPGESKITFESLVLDFCDVVVVVVDDGKAVRESSVPSTAVGESETDFVLKRSTVKASSIRGKLTKFVRLPAPLLATRGASEDV